MNFSYMQQHRWILTKKQTKNPSLSSLLSVYKFIQNNESTTRCLVGHIIWSLLKIWLVGASLVAQWLRIHLPMQGTWIWSLVQEDPTCHGATKPVHHNYWAWALEPSSHNYWAHAPQLPKPERSRASVPQLLSPHAAAKTQCSQK